LRTGWRGRAVLEDVQVNTPLDPRPLFTARRVEVRHTPVLGLLFGRGLAIQSVRTDGPTLTVARGDDGRLNVERLNPRPNKGGRRGPWPELRIPHATLRVVDTPVRSVELKDLSLTGRPVRQGGGEWDGQVDVPGYGQADVRVAPGGEH